MQTCIEKHEEHQTNTLKNPIIIDGRVIRDGRGTIVEIPSHDTLFYNLLLYRWNITNGIYELIILLKMKQC